MRRVKLPWAACPEVATAYFTSCCCRDRCLHQNCRAGRGSLTTSRATAAKTGASSSSSTRDEECQTSLGRLPRSRHCMLHCFDRCCCRGKCFQRESSWEKEVLDNIQSDSCCDRSNLSKQMRDEACEPSSGGLPRSRHCILHCFDVVAAGTDASSKNHRAARRKSSTRSKQQLLQQEQALQAARVMRRVKPPRADCFQVATAYSLPRPLLLQGQMLPANRMSWEKGVLDDI